MVVWLDEEKKSERVRRLERTRETRERERKRSVGCRDNEEF